MRTEGVQQGEAPPIDALRDLVEQGAKLRVDTPAFELARWRARALYELAEAIPPGHPAVGVLTASSAWLLDEADPRQAERSLALGWAPLLGALEAQLDRCGQSRPPSGSAPFPRESDSTEKDSGGEDAVTPTASGPYLQLLGPVQVHGAPGPVDSNRLRSLIEYACWIHLNPGKGHHRLTRAFGWAQNKTTRNAQTCRLRKWFGAEALPPVLSDSGYSFSPVVTSDWAQFQYYHQRSRQRSAHAAAHLQSALQLVRGVPFADAPTRYRWALPVADAMTREIVEAALRLAELRQTEHDLTQALWALRRGLMAMGSNGMELDCNAPPSTADQEAVERTMTDLHHFVTRDPVLELVGDG